MPHPAASCQPSRAPRGVVPEIMPRRVAIGNNSLIIINTKPTLSTFGSGLQLVVLGITSIIFIPTVVIRVSGGISLKAGATLRL